jgi:uncharacterized protein
LPTGDLLGLQINRPGRYFRLFGHPHSRLGTAQFPQIITCSSRIWGLALLRENVFLFSVVNPTSMPWDFLLILMALGILVPWRGAVRVQNILRQPVFGPRERLSLYASTIAYQSLIVAVVAWRGFSRKLAPSELGLTLGDPWRTAWIALAFTTLLCANQWASFRRMVRSPETQRGLMFRIMEKIMPRTSNETVIFAALACTAGLSEEFLYRGFVFAVFVRLFATSAMSVSIAAVLSSAWFAIAHSYQGWRGVITTFVVGILFVLVRIWTGSLLPSVAAHAGIDLVAGLVASRLFPNG